MKRGTDAQDGQRCPDDAALVAASTELLEGLNAARVAAAAS